MLGSRIFWAGVDVGCEGVDGGVVVVSAGEGTRGGDGWGAGWHSKEGKEFYAEVAESTEITEITENTPTRSG